MKDIEVSTPAEIRKYEKLWFAAITRRQMIFAIIIILFTLAIHTLCELVLGIPSLMTYMLIMIVNIPVTIIGYIPIKGLYFEEYFHSMFNGLRQPKKLGKYSSPPDEVLELIKKSQLKGR